MTVREKGWLTALVILAIMALVELFYIPGTNQLLLELNNAGHLPVFGILAVAMLHLVKLVRPALRQNPQRAYLMAFVFAVALGALSEGIQYYGPRDADPIDLARDVIGAASFLALYAALRDPDLFESRRSSGAFRNKLLLFTAVLWLLGGWSLLTWSAAFANRSRILPVLCDFSSSLSTRFLDPNEATLERGVVSLATGLESRGTRLHFEGAERPGVDLFDVYPDWTGHDSLVLEVTVEEDFGLMLGLAVYDRKNNEKPDDKFSTVFAVDPGRHRIAVSLGQIITGPRNRRLDLTLVDGVEIFTDSSGVGKSVLLERLLLK